MDFQHLDPLQAAALGGLFVITMQMVGTLCVWSMLRSASRENHSLNREMFGLVKKIDGFTSLRREQMLQHYDRMLETLSDRLPTLIASQASAQIFDAESRIVTRLAELEPQIKHDATSQRKMDELIKSMEALESTIVSLTSDAVKKIMVDGRRELFDESKFFDIDRAA